ncbi:MAG: DNA helicase RecQ, partial [SAR202 cluster bacterium]|nr:DNA helicase RecQ [SAR202 cluster bacterium]
SQVLSKLKAVFGYTEFRPLQEDIVKAILNRKDVFVLMPTGGGKSLCYQLPALLMEGMTVVVSPLIALMKDQVDRLRMMGVPATYINSSLEPAEAGRRRAAVARGEVKLLYVAPERLMMPAMLDLLLRRPPAAFAIDEAHCISEWGHDFRPEYRELRRLRELFASAAFAAFTATATARVQADIVSQLGLDKALSFRRSFNRPNLYYEVRPKRDAYGQLRRYLSEHKRESGIIYCHSRAGTERLAQRLREDGFSADAYHAGLPNEARRHTQEAFARDDTHIVVATIAFGMGIDKPDVRFVVHYDLPKNLEGYYQESGRAGRDGEPSDCILFYTYGDAAKHEYFIDEKESAAERAVAAQQLRSMVEWAEGRGCRRRGLLAYFDEELKSQVTPCCDICRNPAPEVDCTIPAQMLLSCAKRTGEWFGMTYLIRMLVGSRDQRILQAGHDKLSTYGIGRDRSKEEWRALGDELLRHGYARLDPARYNAVRATPLGEEVLFKGRRALLPIVGWAAASASPAPSQGGDSRPDLFERLRSLRKRLADERSVPPYVVFHDTALRQMAAQLPTSIESFARIQGVGERKLQDYGAAFIAEISEYARQAGAQAAALPPPPSKPPRPARVKGDSIRQTVDSFKKGMSPSEIAEERGLALSTILGHLAQAVEKGEALDVGRLVTDERRRAIETALEEMGTLSLSALRECLGEDYGYHEIRIVAAAWRVRQRRLLT